MSLDSNWKISYTPTAADDLRNLPKNIQKRIVDKMRFFLLSGNPMKFSESIKDKSLGDFRFRVGDYRVVFDIIAGKTISVVNIKKRDKVYK